VTNQYEHVANSRIMPITISNLFTSIFKIDCSQTICVFTLKKGNKNINFHIMISLKVNDCYLNSHRESTINLISVLCGAREGGREREREREERERDN